MAACKLLSRRIDQPSAPNNQEPGGNALGNHFLREILLGLSFTLRCSLRTIGSLRVRNTAVIVADADEKEGRDEPSGAIYLLHAGDPSAHYTLVRISSHRSRLIEN
ncbi:hypothetical protein ATY81_21905 [Rhizobium sp. R72]|nr:hypothetical protein ATY81_21905 [Rhizobium sp. R72]OWW02444.1 hypothetical protein ATY80_21905 [Rhizobium sp. R711]